MWPSSAETLWAFSTPNVWWPASSHGGDDLLPGLLGSFDRLCGQFAVALQNAEHDHLFLFAALVGTITLVFPAHR
jgi:hypothetical protein